MSVGHYENFPVASLLLPPALREPVGVIYRFARSADDIADEGDHPPQARLARLQEFRLELEGINSGRTPHTLLFADLARVVRERRLPLPPFHDLLDAFAQDVVKKRYADFAELLDYCRRSANPVGRLLLILFGKNTEAHCGKSDSICSALQLINFWQDIAIDYVKGRIYLPQDEMRSFGVSEANILAQQCNGAWLELMKFQTERARDLMLSGSSLGRELPGRIGLQIRATVQGGLRILEKLERAGYDMFRHRPVLKWHDWPLLLWRTLL
ncbi:MAG: squalene synthase HpnC [Betaproteobacteria bacterium]|nr:squalene synthase HpnC [Betaproteobacteria bacterium]